MNLTDLLLDILTGGLLLYSAVLLLSYICIGVYSIGAVRGYLQKNSFVDYRILAASPEAPSMSILAPAYNEGATVVENAKSLLSIHYNNLEVIIINDGSKDDCLQKLIDNFDLQKVDFFYNEQIPTKKVRGVYRSTNKVYRKLVVVDKENGGKADALNVGINISSNNYIVCIDVDCILEQDALLKLAKPFLEKANERVIATGGVVRIANGCEVEGGRLMKVKLADSFLPRIQTLEYFRAFLLGRMAWSRINGLLLISGAFGAFDKEIVINCGGYNHKTVGEDMELVVRMRRYMEEQKAKYRVTFIPDPLCWTEAPADYKILGRQRNRWTRGTIETLLFHKKMFFNPRYGLVGMLSYPYWFFFEFLAPIIEFGGLLVFLFFAFFGHTNWENFFVLFAFILSFGFLYSVFAILMEVMTYNQYKDPKDLGRLIWTAFLEPVLFHPFVVWSAIEGNVDFLQKKSSWGEMTRQGFATKKLDAPAQTSTQQAPQPAPAIKASEEKTWQETVRSFGTLSMSWLLISLLFALFEVNYHGIMHGYPESPQELLPVAFRNAAIFWLRFNIIVFLPYIFLYRFSRTLATGLFSVIVVLVAFIQIVLIEFYSVTLAPLGSNLYFAKAEELKTYLEVLNNLPYLATFNIICLVALATSIILTLYRRLKIHAYVAILIPLASVVILLSGTSDLRFEPFRSNYANSMTMNKADFFLSDSYRYLSLAAYKKYLKKDDRSQTTSSDENRKENTSP